MSGKKEFCKTDIHEKRARLASYKIEKIERPGPAKLFFMIFIQLGLIIGLFEFIVHRMSSGILYFSFIFIFIVGVSLVFSKYIRSIQEKRKTSEKEREQLITDLQETLTEVKTLTGLLPICAKCKKIRDSEGYWQQIEQYVQAHSEAEFSHAVCKDCAKELYPDIYEEIYSEDKG